MKKMRGVLEHALVALVSDMMESDVRLIQRDEYFSEAGFNLISGNDY